MSDDLLNILSNSNKDIDNQKLMDYLSDKLSPKEKHEFEEKMADSEMLNDVVEGLEKLKNKKDISTLVEQLNANLKKQLEKKKAKKLKREIKNLSWLYFSIILIIIIVLIGFLVIRRHLEQEQNPGKIPSNKEVTSFLHKKAHSFE
jgi:ABC-type bacteriocin/lantibiotic exporter with double-glycine peptidase domain